MVVATPAEYVVRPGAKPCLSSGRSGGEEDAPGRIRDYRGDAMAAVTFDGVSKVYPDGTRAVDRLSLDIQDGEFMVLVGPSGCGKTTALRMLAGLEEISEGRVSIGERVVNHVPSRDRDIAMVFQSYALYPHLSRVREHRLRPARQEGAEGRDRRARQGRRAHPRPRGRCSTASRARSRAASASASPWAARSCATRRPS